MCIRDRYFSIILDNTSDAAHVEQMSQIIRFVDTESNSVDIKDCLLYTSRCV